MESPHDLFRQTLAATGDRIAAIRTIRERFGLDLRQAKEVMLQAEGTAASLDEHQEQLALLLEQALAAQSRAESGAAVDGGGSAGVTDAIVANYMRRYRSLGLTGTPSDSKTIAALREHLGLQLPRAYRAYLLIAGLEPPPKLVGSDCHGDYLPSLREGGQELLKESGSPFELPEDTVVFLMHQGYQFFYFRADGNTDDPPVFYYFENWPAAEQKYECFSDWVAAIATNRRTPRHEV